MMQITDINVEQRILPLFRLAFRPFFLGAACYSIVALTIWTLSLTGKFEFIPYGNTLWWHAHEMVFGFSFTVIIGFLLTAIQSWTGIPSIRGWRLVLLFASWLLARALLLFNLSPSYWVLVIDITPPLLAATFLWKNITAAKHWKNLFFVPILLLFAIANGLSHLGVIHDKPQLSSSAFTLLVILITLVMCIVGGRVIPFFTARGTGTEKTSPWFIIEHLSLMPLWLYIGLAILNTFVSVPTGLLSFLLLTSGLANLIRFCRWKLWLTFNIPLLWSLHCAYLFIPLGLVMYGVAMLSNPQHLVNALHLITVGAIGNLIISMMARVSLGHTGRKLSPKPIMNLAFLAMIIAAPIRALLPIVQPQLTLISYQLSSGLWGLAYGIFIICYAKMLWSPRPDGRPG